MTETRRCPKCKKERALSDWGKRWEGRYFGECRFCNAAKTTAFLAAGKLTPRDVFLAFKSFKPQGVRHLIERPGERACGTCYEWKPTETFRTIYKHGKAVGMAWMCRDCRVAQVKRYQKERPEQYARYSRTSRENLKKRREAGALILGKRKKKGLHELDVLRRALVERPKELLTEEERAAYFRGFVAGAQRSGSESERFERLKDLCHRIAAEKGVYGQIYEERVSWAYEGLLAFVRKRLHKGKEYASVEEERKLAACAIRSYIIDCLRTEGPFSSRGIQRHTTDVLSSHETEDGVALWDKGSAQLAAQSGAVDTLDGSGIEGKDRETLELLASGHTYEDIGRKFGVSWSAIHQRVRKIRRKFPELERRLEAAV